MKALILKIVILAVVVCGGQIIVGRYVVPSISALTFGIAGIGKLDTYLYQHNTYPVLYFGDSVIKSFDDNDADKSSIAEMLSTLDPKISIGDMSSPSYHLGMFEAMMVHIEQSDQKPEAVIIPINLRSFAPLWDEQPEYEFKDEMFFLTHNKLFFYFGKPMSIWHVLNLKPKSEEQFRSTPIVIKGDVVTTVGEYVDELNKRGSDEEMIGKSYQYFYLPTISAAHRKLDSLRRIISIAHATGITLYFYVVPIDYEDGTKYVGPGFTPQIIKNARVTCEVAEEEGERCLNLVTSLKSKDFAHPGLPNEHLKESGRRAVARALQAFIEGR